MVSLVPPKRKKKVLNTYRLHIVESMSKGDYGLLQSTDLVHLPKGFMSLSIVFLQLYEAVCDRKDDVAEMKCSIIDISYLPELFE